MTDYIVESKSRQSLRTLANDLRKMLHLENTLKMPIVNLLDIMPDMFDGFS